MRYAFADCVLDTQLHTLSRGGRHRRLRPKVLQVLAYLLAHRDRVISKQELCDQIWAAQAVTDAAIENCMKAVRRAIGDDGRAQRLIETQYGYGYRFVAPVTVFPEEHGGTASDETLIAEQKIATVLCCASTTMPIRGRPNPEALHQWLPSLDDIVRSELQRYGGTLQSTAGGRMVAIFGAPIAQEDHAQRAALAALGIRQQLREQRRTLAADSAEPLMVSMGLHTGHAAVGETGKSSAPDPQPVGETIAQALVLQELAASGDILCSDATARLVRQVARCQALSPEAGRSMPTPTYNLVGRRARRRLMVPYATHTRRPPVGRHRELAMLQAVWADVEKGRGHVVGIVGEPGMGKSRLVDEFRRHLRGESHAYVRGYCVSYGQAMPYQPVRTLLQHACGITEADTSTAMVANLQRHLRTLDMEPRATLPYLLSLLRRQDTSEQVAGLSPEEYEASMFTTLLQMCLNGCRRRPLVIEVEDLHWIDASSEACLMALVERLAGVPLLLLVTYRPGYRPPWIDKSYVTQVSLTRLSADDSQRLVKAILATRPVSAMLLEQLVAKADGNPFFLEALAQSVIDQGMTPPTLRLPDTVRAVLATRIDRLPPTAKRVLQVAAVIGQEVPLALLQAACALPKVILAQNLASLQTAEFLYETHLMPASVYAFRHVLTQEAAYHSLLKSSRQQLHQQIAQVLATQFPEMVAHQPELLAYHYTQAELIESAIVYWQRAGQRAAGRAGHAEAIASFRQGLELLYRLPVTPERVRQELTLQCRLGVQLAAQGSATAEIEHTYTRALELCQQVGDTQHLFPVLFGLSRLYKKRGKLRKAVELGMQCLILAQDQPVSTLRLCAHYALGDTLFWRGEFSAARAHLEQGISCDNPDRHHAHAFLYEPAPGLSCLGVLSLTLWFLGYPDQALQRSHEALALAQEVSHPYSLARALYYSAALHALRREWQAVQERAEALRALAAAQGFAELLALATRSHGLARVEQGQIAEGIAQMQQGMADLQVLRTVDGQATQLAQLAKMYGHAGQPEEGLRLLNTAMTARQDTEERFDEVGRFRLKGELLLLLPHPDRCQAASCFRQALAIARGQQAKSLELRTTLRLSHLWQQQGKRDQARQVLAQSYGWFTEGFDTPDLQEAKALLQQL